VASAWDQRSAGEQRRVQDVLVKQTVLQMALAHVPLARTRLNGAGVDARTLRGVDDLKARVPLSMRRDVMDSVRNPDGPWAFVLQGTAEGVKRFSDRSVLFRVARARLLGGEEVQQLQIEAASRSVHVHLAPGVGGPIPVSYTRDDLDLLARAGARLAQLVGIDREDRLLNLVPFGPTLEYWGIFYMAHGVGLTSVHARQEGGQTDIGAAAFSMLNPTAVAVPADEAAQFPDAAGRAGIDLTGVRTLVAVGRSLTKAERERVGEGLLRAGAEGARIAAAYGVAEGRVLWAECAVPAGKTETFGFHTYPDMDVLEIVSPETGEALDEETPGEIVITPLGFRGGGVPRWRSGDLALGGVTTRTCPNCARDVPRVGPTVRRGAWIRRVSFDGVTTRYDLRDSAALLTPRMNDWQVELASNGTHTEFFLYLAPKTEDAGQVIGIYEEHARWQVPPTQIVLATPDEIAAKRGAVDGLFTRFAER
jgi:phenylacetate-coenzyme A ligase PaaK-like adenylate-forming protein